MYHFVGLMPSSQLKAIAILYAEKKITVDDFQQVLRENLKIIKDGEEISDEVLRSLTALFCSSSISEEEYVIGIRDVIERNRQKRSQMIRDLSRLFHEKKITCDDFQQGLRENLRIIHDREERSEDILRSLTSLFTLSYISEEDYIAGIRDSVPKNHSK